MSSNKANDAFNRLISLCLQGRGREGLVVARKIPLKQLPVKKRRIVREFISRFSSANAVQKAHNDPIRKLISIFEDYWHKVLLNSKDKSQLERKLFKHIVAWMRDELGVSLKTSSREAIVNRLKKEVESLGYFCITGTVAPFFELEIWKKQKKIVYSVALPESSEKVNTILMSDFLTMGWMAYATMGLNYPGGWAKSNGIYCNTHAYNLKSEKFRISYLAHEAQHYADYKRFPLLNQIDMEYRAKLTELAMSKKTTKKIFQVLVSRADNNRKSPHAFSNFCVVRDLTKLMKGHTDFKQLAARPSLLKTSEVNNSAILLLKQHTQVLKLKGAKKVKSSL